MLIVDASHHPNIIENQYLLFRDIYDVSIFVIPDKKRSYEILMPVILDECPPRYSFHSTTIFMQLILIGYKYDYIHISTGPESDHYSSTWTIPAFGLCCILYRNKVILTIKNIRLYLSSTPGIFSLLRSIIIRFVKRFMFETNTMRKTFISEVKHKFKSATVYNRYVDLTPNPIPRISEKSPDKNIIRLGLLGGIDPHRRDYQKLINALRGMGVRLRKQIHIIIVGQCLNGRNNSIVQEMKSIVDVDCPNYILSVEEFDQKGASCDILISPLSDKLEYGTYKGTGAISDAIYLQKKIILPSFSDPEKEFSFISYYYDTLDELTGILAKLNNLSRSKISQEQINRFTTRNIRYNIINELAL